MSSIRDQGPIGFIGHWLNRRGFAQSIIEAADEIITGEPPSDLSLVDEICGGFRIVDIDDGGIDVFELSSCEGLR